MKKYVTTIILAIVCLFAPCHVAYARANTVAKLTIHTYGDSLGSSGSVGHAFLSIKNTSKKTLSFCSYPIKPGKMISVSIWPDSMGNGGVFINREMVVSKNITTTSISINITQKQFDKIAKKTPSESYYHDGLSNDWNLKNNLWHNCTTYSRKIWNMVAPKKMRLPSGAYGIDAPKWLGEKIKATKGFEKKKFTHGQTIDESDIFYLASNKALVPYKIKTPSLKLRKKTKNSVSLKWTVPEKKLFNKKKNITQYDVRYYPSDDPNDYTDKTIRSKKIVINNLKSGKTYIFLVCAVYNNGNYTTRSKWSRKLKVTIPTEAASIELDKSLASLYEGDSLTLKAAVKGAAEAVIWQSLNPEIASVTNGVVLARKEGTTTIEARANGKTAKCEITVKKQPGVFVGEHSIYRRYDLGMTWANAVDYCKSMGGHLVVVTSAEEQKIVENLLKEGKKNSYWMGGYKNSQGEWVWLTTEAFNYRHWASGQPDNYGSKGEDSLMVYRNQNPLSSGTYLGTWNDLYHDGTCEGEKFFGTENLGFIFEKEFE